MCNTGIVTAGTLSLHLNSKDIAVCCLQCLVDREDDIHEVEFGGISGQGIAELSDVEQAYLVAHHCIIC